MRRSAWHEGIGVGTPGLWRAGPKRAGPGMAGLWRLGLLALATCVVGGSASAQDFDEVRIQVVEVAPGVAMLVGRGGNIGVSTGPDGVLLVDDQFGQLTDKIRAAVATLSDQPIRYVLNTHWHGDHSGGNENLARGGAVLVAHHAVRTRMASEHWNPFFQRRTPPSPREALPIVTFGEDISFHWNGIEIHAFHPGPAHTDGDAIVIFRGVDVVHMGDTYFNGIYPFIDVSSGGSVNGMIAAVEVALGRMGASTKVIPGHGPLSDRAGLEAYLAMLTRVRDRVQAGIRRGQTADQIVAAAPTADLDPVWGKGFLTPEQFVRLVHASLSH